jgi:hypothetical protein
MTIIARIAAAFRAAWAAFRRGEEAVASKFSTAGEVARKDVSSVIDDVGKPLAPILAEGEALLEENAMALADDINTIPAKLAAVIAREKAAAAALAAAPLNAQIADLANQVADLRAQLEAATQATAALIGGLDAAPVDDTAATPAG